MAQVDWSIAGYAGPSACPPGQSEETSFVTVGDITKNSAVISTAALSLAVIRSRLGNQALTAVTPFVNVKENGGNKLAGGTGVLRLVTVGQPTAPSATRKFASLKPNTRYTAIIHSGNTNASKVIARSCFKTAVDMEIPFGSGRSVGPGDSWSSGCFAFGGTRNQVLACMCGARNASGQWARTDSQDGYEYIISDTNWRQRVGCTTN